MLTKSKKIGGDVRTKEEISTESFGVKTVNFPGLKGQLPVRTGTMRMTEYEKKTLESLGWSEGDPLPSNLAEQISAIQAQNDEVALPVPPDTPPLKLPREIDIADLPEEKQQEIRQALETAKKQMTEYESRQSDAVSGAGPGVNEAIQAGRKKPVNITNDKRKVDARQLPSTPPPTAEDATVSAAGTKSSIKNCPHCNWSLDIPDTLEIDPNDKINYVSSVLGQKRFRKSYKLFDGQLIVYFRSLTLKEVDMSYRQIVVDSNQDANDKRLSDQATYMTNLFSYRAVMALEAIESSETGRIDVEEIGKTTFDKDAFKFPDTPLKAYYPLVADNALSTDTIRRVVLDTYTDFEATVAKMEARAKDPNFWRLTESRR